MILDKTRCHWELVLGTGPQLENQKGLQPAAPLVAKRIFFPFQQ